MTKPWHYATIRFGGFMFKTLLIMFSLFCTVTIFTGFTFQEAFTFKVAPALGECLTIRDIHFEKADGIKCIEPEFKNIGIRDWMNNRHTYVGVVNSGECKGMMVEFRATESYNFRKCSL